MERTCFKTLKLQNFCKMLGERCETETPIFQNSFKVIYCDQKKKKIETSKFQAI